ncbi:MAG: CoA transferase [Deltaproteobacteria bacterium]|nr:CoA transferase [Deltaproteobacteria bacterium]
MLDVRVLDLSTEIAGPYCGRLLRDAGAQVLKVEPPEGDPLRRWTASEGPLPSGADGALFQYLNGGKRSLALDLEAAAGREQLLSLAADADLVLESFGPGEMARLGLDHATLARANPALSLVSISPFGGDGPWARRPATEWTLQAATGAMARRGLPERGPVGIGGRVGEWVAGAYASFGAICAWLSARRTGRGQHVDLSTFETMLQCGTQYHDLNGQFQGTPLSQFVDTPSLEPARDGWVGFATVTAQQWQDFCVMIGQPELAENKKYHHTDGRMQDLDFIHGLIRSWTREHSVDEIVSLATALRIPVAPVGNGESVRRMDHFVARGVFEPHPGGFVQPRVPYRLERPVASASGPQPAPRLDEHAGARFPARSGGSICEDASPFPFDGLRVLDLTAFWAGPFLTEHLAMMGADVVKVESVQRPDGMRFVNAMRNKTFWECGSIFHGANCDKRDITLRLDSEEGRDLFLRLVDRADVLVENFSVRVLANLGIDPADLRRRNPRLIVIRMPSWGLDGPWWDRVGFAMNVEQACGLAWLSGYEDLPMIVNVCDPIGGLHAFVALAIALEQRRATGEGQLIEVPLVETGLCMAAEQVIEHSAYGRTLLREGNHGPHAAPQGIFCCRGENEWLALAVATEVQWRALATVLGEPEWTRSPELESHAGRRAARRELEAHLARELASRDRDDLVRALNAAGVPAQELVNAHFVMPNPQLEHRGFYQELDHPFVGRRRYPVLPMRFSAFGPALHRSPPPTLGQHNDEVLGGELGLDAAEREALRERKIIGDRPAWR